VPRSVHKEPTVVAEHSAKQDLTSLLEQYRPMLRLLSASDLLCLKRRGYPNVGHFRRERTAIYFQYLFELLRDLRALPLWTAPSDAEEFMELDKASWTMQKMLIQLAWAGVLYFIGIRRSDSSLVERCFEKLGNMLSVAA
jgi:hypothetical protein